MIPKKYSLKGVNSIPENTFEFIVAFNPDNNKYEGYDPISKRTCKFSIKEIREMIAGKYNSSDAYWEIRAI